MGYGDGTIKCDSHRAVSPKKKKICQEKRIENDGDCYPKEGSREGLTEEIIELKGGREQGSLGKSGNSMCKGSEVGACLACYKRSQVASAAMGRGRVVRMRSSEWQGSIRSLVGHGKDFGFCFNENRLRVSGTD